MDEEDLEKFKEKHHIFWRTYEGFDELTNSMVNTKKCIEIIDDKNNTNNNIKNLLHYIKKVFLFSKQKRSLKQNSEESLLLDPKCNMKNAGEKIINNKHMNIYCVSKEDLFEIITQQLKRKKKVIEKRNLH